CGARGDRRADDEREDRDAREKTRELMLHDFSSCASREERLPPGGLAADHLNALLSPGSGWIDERPPDPPPGASCFVFRYGVGALRPIRLLKTGMNTVLLSV